MKSILLATSNVDHVISLADLLQESGYMVIPAGNADLAYSFFRQEIKVDAVIADIGMKDFWGVLGIVKLQRPLPPPIIVLGERVTVAEYLDTISTGIFDFIFFPTHKSQVLAIVNSAVSRSRMHSAFAGAKDAAGRRRYLRPADNSGTGRENSSSLSPG